MEEEDLVEATCEQLRPHVEQAISKGADIDAIRDGHVRWTNGQCASVHIYPGGYIVAFNEMTAVCTEEQLGRILLIVNRQLTRQFDA